MKTVMIGFRPGRKTPRRGYTLVIGQGVKHEYPIYLNTTLKREMQLREEVYKNHEGTK